MGMGGLIFHTSLWYIQDDMVAIANEKMASLLKKITTY